MNHDIPIENSNSDIPKPVDDTLALAHFASAFVGGAIIAKLTSNASLLGNTLHATLSAMSAPFHEVGHALTAWLCGIPTIPSFVVAMHLTAGTSTTISLVLIGAFFWLAYKSYKKQDNLFLFIFLSLVPLTLVFSFAITPETQNALILLSGQGGEIWLGAIGMLCFFNKTLASRFPKLRLYLLWTGSSAMWAAFFLWLKTFKDKSALPMGGIFDGLSLGEAPSQGDLDRLIRDYQWTTEQIISTNAWIAVICISLVCAVFTWKVLKKLY